VSGHEVQLLSVQDPPPRPTSRVQFKWPIILDLPDSALSLSLNLTCHVSGILGSNISEFRWASPVERFIFICRHMTSGPGGRYLQGVRMRRNAPIAHDSTMKMIELRSSNGRYTKNAPMRLRKMYLLQV
jgi:hypothetical protein